MEKQLIRYLYYYIGCECIFYMADDDPCGTDATLSIELINRYLAYPEETAIYLKLRSLEDITEEECKQYNKIKMTMHSVNKIQDQIKTDAAATDYLIKQRFDVFNLEYAKMAVYINS